MAHANARLNEYGRQLAVERYLAGHKVRDIAGQLGVSRPTIYKWIARFREGGRAGLADRSSRPHQCPRQTPKRIELRIVLARLNRRVGPVQLAAELGLAASTIGAVLRRWRMPLLAHLDSVTGALIRSRASENRYEHPRPGDLLHVDVKKLGRIPDGGGWRVQGHSALTTRRDPATTAPGAKTAGVGFEFIHVAIDDHTRLVYSEILPDEKAGTCAQFLHRAAEHFHHQHGVTIRRVLTDNAMSYRRGSEWAAVCSALQIRRRFIKPGCPWTNGKAERFNRTLLTEWAYTQPWTTNTERAAAFDVFLDRYNTRRAHTALGGRPPISRLAA